jgi:hypothetical protein
MPLQSPPRLSSVLASVLAASLMLAVASRSWAYATGLP